MQRKEKIQLLQEFKEGKVTIADLQPPQRYLVFSSESGMYEINGKKYDETSYQDFCREKVRKQDILITLQLDSRCEPLPGELREMKIPVDYKKFSFIFNCEK